MNWPGEMADDLADYPIVVLEADYPETVGKVGLFDFLMRVGATGIVFVAAVPGLLQSYGPVFSSIVQTASRLRAASTLVQMGLISGDTFAFFRVALELTQQDVATMYNVPLATVQAWEANTLPVPRETWACLGYRVCLKDGRAMPADYALPPPSFRARLIRVFPNIPVQPMVEAASPLCPIPSGTVVPCPSKNPLC